MNKKEIFNKRIYHFYQKHHHTVHRLLTRKDDENLLSLFMLLDSLRDTLNDNLKEEDEIMADHLIALAEDVMEKIDEYVKNYMEGEIWIEDLIHNLAEEGKLPNVGIREILESRQREQLRKEKRRCIRGSVAFVLGTCFALGFLVLKKK